MMMMLHDDYGDEIAVKVVIVGNGAVGKSSLIQRYCRGIFTAQYKKTIGVDFLERTIKARSEDVRLMLWDTAGQEEFDALTKAYYRGAQACVIGFSSTDRESFLAVERWKKKVEYECGSIPMVLVQNKMDLTKERTVLNEEASALADRLRLRLFRTSVKENRGVDDVFRYLTESYLNSLDEEDEEDEEDDEEQDESTDEETGSDSDPGTDITHTDHLPDNKRLMRSGYNMHHTGIHFNVPPPPPPRSSQSSLEYHHLNGGNKHPTKHQSRTTSSPCIDYPVKSAILPTNAAINHTSGSSNPLFSGTSRRKFNEIPSSKGNKVLRFFTGNTVGGTLRPAKKTRSSSYQQPSRPTSAAGFARSLFPGQYYSRYRKHESKNKNKSKSFNMIPGARGKKPKRSSVEDRSSTIVLHRTPTHHPMYPQAAPPQHHPPPLHPYMSGQAIYHQQQYHPHPGYYYHFNGALYYSAGKQASSSPSSQHMKGYYGHQHHSSASQHPMQPATLGRPHHNHAHYPHHPHHAHHNHQERSHSVSATEPLMDSTDGVGRRSSGFFSLGCNIL